MLERLCPPGATVILRSWSSHGALQRSTRCQYCTVQQLTTNSCDAFWHTCCTLPIHDGVCLYIYSLWGGQNIHLYICISHLWTSRAFHISFTLQSACTRQ